MVVVAPPYMVNPPPSVPLPIVEEAVASKSLNIPYVVFSNPILPIFANKFVVDAFPETYKLVVVAFVEVLLSAVKFCKVVEPR